MSFYPYPLVMTQPGHFVDCQVKPGNDGLSIPALLYLSPDNGMFLKPTSS